MTDKMNQQEIELGRYSKFMSLVLRHKPETIGLILDENGWASVNELIEKMNARDCQLTPALVEHIVATNNKKRFTFNDDRTRIRANQGHSLQVDLQLEAKTPPPILYHGTAQKYVPSILESGLLKQQRQHVHLSTDTATAIQVGQRQGKPVVLEVNAEKMQDDGYTFYLSQNGVWLTTHVPAIYIKRK